MLVQGDARTLPLRDGVVACVVTSPPYFGLRDYEGHAQQIGQEPTPDTYVESLVTVFRELRRVLRDDGTVWLNLGDNYANDAKWGGYSGGKHVTALHGTTGIGRRRLATGLKSKDLIGIPWRVAFALQDDGWYLRSDIIWSKPSCMPESVTDRPTRSHEYLFLLTKSQKYFYDADAIREPHAEAERVQSEKRRMQRMGRSVAAVGEAGQSSKGIDDGTVEASHMMATNPDGRNKRTVWTVATVPYAGAHFATMPEKLVEPCILAGTSQAGYCRTCGAPRVRVVERETYRDVSAERAMPKTPLPVVRAGWRDPENAPKSVTVGWSPSCDCGADAVPGIVLDPFVGSGTVVAVAQRFGRYGVGVDLSYQHLAKERTAQRGLMFV